MTPELRGIADYLLTCNTRADIDVTKITAAYVPHLYILEIKPIVQSNAVAKKVRLRIRLCGTALDTAFGRNLQGHFMDEFLHGPTSVEVLTNFENCAVTRKPVWMRQVVQIAHKAPRFVEGVAVYIEPQLIYGGLIFGELSRDYSGKGFEKQEL